jgi:hypothetical protein
MSTTSSETSAGQVTPQVPALLRIVLSVFAVSCLIGFYYGNAHSENFRLAYKVFTPPLWNVYLTCSLASLVGIFALWYGRRWGFYLLAFLAVVTLIIEVYAMGFSVATLRIPIAITLIWITAQPAWKSFR